MKKYEYVSIENINTNYDYYKTNPHRSIIDEYAKKGYKYVGYIPTDTGTSGIKALDLIFEIDYSNDF